MSSILSLLDALRAGLPTGWAARYAFAANFTIQIYGYFTTLDQEYYFYKSARGLSLTKTLFLMNRYIPFGNTLVDFYTFLFANPQPENCNKLISVSTYLVSLQFIVAEYVLFYRASVVWMHNTIVVVISLITLMVTSALGLFYGHEYTHSVQTFDANLASPGCIVVKSGSVTRELVLITTTEIVSLLLLAMQFLWSARAKKVLPHVRTSGPDLMRVMFKDGLAYFICIIAICTANTVSNVLSQLGTAAVFHAALLPLQATMQNVLCVRLLLHVRLTNAIAMGEHENELSMMVAATTHDPRSLAEPERGRTRNVNAPMRRLRVNDGSTIVFNTMEPAGDQTDTTTRLPASQSEGPV